MGNQTAVSSNARSKQRPATALAVATESAHSSAFTGGSEALGHVSDSSLRFDRLLVARAQSMSDAQLSVNHMQSMESAHQVAAEARPREGAKPGFWGRLWRGSVESLKAAGSFLKGMADDLGLTDVAVGVGKLCRGDLSGGWQAIKGAAKAFFEFTCLSDVWGLCKHGALAIGCLATGDWKGCVAHLGQAAFHGAFVAMAAGAYLFTGGSGLVAIQALRTGLKTVAKQAIKEGVKIALKECGEHLGKQLVEKLGEKLSTEVLRETGAKIARDGLNGLAKSVLGKDSAKLLMSAATNPEMRAQLANELLEKAGPEAFDKVMAQSGEGIGSRLMKQAGVRDQVAKLTEEFVRSGVKSSGKDLAQDLLTRGLVSSASEADELAKSMKAVLKGAGKKSDRELADALTDGIMKPLQQHVDKGVREGFEAEMRALLKGAARNQVDSAVEAGWKGAQRGLNKAMREAVLEGVERGIKAARRVSRDLPISAERDHDTNFEKAGRPTDLEKKPLGESSPETPGRFKAEEATAQDRRPRISKESVIEGRVRKQTYVLEGTQWELESDLDVGPYDRLAEMLRLGAKPIASLGASLEEDARSLTSSDVSNGERRLQRAASELVEETLGGKWDALSDQQSDPDRLQLAKDRDAVAKAIKSWGSSLEADAQSLISHDVASGESRLVNGAGAAFIAGLNLGTSNKKSAA